MNRDVLRHVMADPQAGKLIFPWCAGYLMRVSNLTSVILRREEKHST